MSASILVRIGSAVFLCFLAIGCGGGGGALSTDDVESKVAVGVIEDTVCMETTDEGSDLQTFA